MDIQDYISEPARDLPVLGEFDVVVCGGGPAGCAAAIAATRHGAKTLLVEKEGFLGGAACTQSCVRLGAERIRTRETLPRRLDSPEA